MANNEICGPLVFLLLYKKIKKMKNRKYKCFKIRTKPRRGNPRLQNSIFVNLKMIYATLFLLIKTINYK